MKNLVFTLIFLANFYCAFSSKLWVFFNNPDLDNTLSYTTATVETSGQLIWSTPTPAIGNPTIWWGPAPISYDSDLYVFYRGDTQTQIWFIRYDGTTWYSAEETAISNAIQGAGPAVVEYLGYLWVFWWGGYGQIYYKYTNNPQGSWSVETFVQSGTNIPTTIAAPTAQVLNGILYLFYVDPSDRIFWTSFDGTTWSTPTQVTFILSTSDLSSVVYNGFIYVLNQGQNDGLLWVGQFDGTNYNVDYLGCAPGTVAGTSGAGSTVIGSTLYAFYPGNNPSFTQFYYLAVNLLNNYATYGAGFVYEVTSSVNTPGAIIY